MKKLWNALFGNIHDFSFENRVYNAIIFVTVFQCITAAIYNISKGMPAYLTGVIIIIGLSCLLFYYYSRFQKKFNALHFVLLSSVLLSVVWFLNEGSQGATPFLFLTTSACVISISKKNRHLPYLLILLLTIIGLLYLETNFYQYLMHGHHSEEERRSDVVFFFIFNLIMIFFIVSFLKENYDNENSTIQLQKEALNIQNEKIVSSIKSARFIQGALLPNENYLNSILPEYFIFYKPKDIVSGDFYWVHSNDDKLTIAAADCTGHGVSGAFMSVLGVALLNEIVQKLTKANVGEILDELREQIKKVLNQPGRETEISYGMDISICSLNIKQNSMQFAGAYNSLYLIRNNEIVEYKADRMPIGLYPKEKPFTSYDIQINNNDVYYIFSDGFEDQHNENGNKKFLKKNFKDLLLKVHQQPMHEQKNIIENTFEKWRGKTEQTDDVLVIGLRIK